MAVQQPAPVQQLIRIYIQDKNNKMTTVFEEFPITKRRKNKFHLTWKKDRTASYKITRDSEISLQELVNYDDYQIEGVKECQKDKSEKQSAGIIMWKMTGK